MNDFEFSEDIPSILVNLEPTPYDDLFTHVVHEDVDQFTENVWQQVAGKILHT